MKKFNLKPNEKDLVFEQAKQNIEKRFGVTLMEYMGFAGNKSEVQKKIKRAMQKETLKELRNLQMKNNTGSCSESHALDSGPILYPNYNQTGKAGNSVIVS